METALRIQADIHTELKAACQEKKIPMSAGAGALLRFALDALKCGDLELTPVSAVKPQSQTEEASV